MERETQEEGRLGLALLVLESWIRADERIEALTIFWGSVQAHSCCATLKHACMLSAGAI